MAERRMFSKKIVCSDSFLDLSMDAQLLYFHLGMAADDDGFVSNPKAVTRLCGASSDSLNELTDKRFILKFEESNVVLVKHWLINNQLRKDRKTSTTFQSLLCQVMVKENNSYTERVLGCQSATNCQPNDNQVTTNCQPRLDIDKDIIVKESRLENRAEEKHIDSIRDFIKDCPYIKLSDADLARLIARMGVGNVSKYIAKIDTYNREHSVYKE